MERLALKSSLKHKYGAILVYKNKVISCGYNKDIFRFRERSDNYISGKFSQHAEQMCISKCPKYLLKKCTLYLIRVNEKGDRINCQCCDMCKNLIEKYHIRKVIILI